MEVVRQAYDAWGRGDFRSTLDIYDPHVVFVHRVGPLALQDLAGVYWGVAGLRDYMRKVLDLWSSATLEVEELVEAGDSVVAAIHMRMVGRAGGVPVELPYFHVWTFRGGSVIRFEVVPEREQALEAVGLRD